MAPREAVDETSAREEHELEFAEIWKAIPKTVVSRTLEHIEGNARLIADGLTGPYIPALHDRIAVELVEMRTFGGGVVHLRLPRVDGRVRMR